MDFDANSPPRSDDGEPDGSFESDVTVIGSPSSVTPHNYPSGLTARELSHALRGEMLGHFLLQQFIGGGGMGVVFKALDTTLDRIVAVKVVASQQANDEELQRRFLVEAQSTARLDHPNIARVHFIGRDRGLPYIVFEYIEGLNVRELLAERGPLPVEDALNYVYQIAHALAHAWQRDVVHRDIKPSNILVTPEGQAKLVDMGLARLRQMDAVDEELTATGITLGTFDYISPEQARDPRLADARSDIYSLGCTLFYMLVGHAPFAHGTAVQKLLQHQSERPPELRSFRSDIPESTARLVRRMLAKSPAERPQTPLELIDELEVLLEELNVAIHYPTGAAAWSAARRTTPRWRRHAVWFVPLGLLIGLGVIVDWYARVGTAAATFPPLRVSTAAGAAAEAAPIYENRAVETEPPAPAAATLREDVPVRVDKSEPAPSPRTWDLGQSLWDYVQDWPLTTSPTLADPAGTGEFDNLNWQAPPTPSEPSRSGTLDQSSPRSVGDDGGRAVEELPPSLPRD